MLLYLNREAIANTHSSKVEDGKASSAAYRQAIKEGSVRWYLDLNALLFLYESYKPNRWYWEVVSTLKRIILTAVLAIVSNNNGIQVPSTIRF